MSLLAGTRLAHYEILTPLGAGGMGQVFRARDTQLERLVALKILRDGAETDSEWLARFEREARLLASLNHPNIATLHGRGEEAGIRYLVMELVEGETLRQRLAAGPLPVPEVLLVCRQIAFALEAAHDKGIIHRDLKPANVMITPSGLVKVLDFGLAVSTPLLFSVSSEVHHAPTQVYERPTVEGALLGTPAYMSPEQTRGKSVDKRSDIWAFGCVLYEALTGRCSFAGETLSDTLAAVLERTPDWSLLPAETPPRVVDLLRRCLQKDPQHRLRDIGDARIELDQAMEEHSRGETPRQRASIRLSVPRWGILPWSVLSALLGFLLGLLSIFGLTPRVISTSEATSAKQDVPAGYSGQLLIGGITRAWGPRVSPNGKWLAFIVLHRTQAQLAVMNRDSGNWRVLTEDATHGGVGNFCWSNDSRYLYYDRFHAGPIGICRVSVDQTVPLLRDQLLVESAECPQLLPDKSFIFTRIDDHGNLRLLRTWPGGERPSEEILDQALHIRTGVDETWWPRPVRTLRHSTKVVFVGKLLTDEQSLQQESKLYLLDLEKKGQERLTVLHQAVPMDLTSLALSPDDRFVYFVLPAGDSFQIVRLALDQKEPPQTILVLTGPPYGIEVDAQGNIFFDQFQRAMEYLRFPVLGGTPERVATVSRGLVMQPVELPDSRLLLPSKVLHLDRLLLAVPKQDPLPLLEDQETRPPATAIGLEHLAFVQGAPSRSSVVLARLHDEQYRLVRQLKSISTNDLTSLAASPDGQMLYFVRDKRVYQVPFDEKSPARLLAEGDGVAVHPDGKRLLIQRIDGEGSKLSWLDLATQKAQPIVVRDGPHRIAPDPIGSRAIDAKDRVLVPITTNSTWYWRTGMLDPATGILTPIPVEFSGDIYPANWSANGQIYGLGQTTRGDVWCFTPKQ